MRAIVEADRTIGIQDDLLKNIMVLETSFLLSKLIAAYIEKQTVAHKE